MITQGPGLPASADPDPVRIAVVGTGHVGLVTAATLAELGHTVLAMDDDAAKIRILERGEIPFYERGLRELVERGAASNRLRFTDAVAEAMRDAEVAFICVGTPARPDGEASLLAVERAAAAIGRNATREVVVVHKSTVPVQTAERVTRVLRRTCRHPFHVVSNPEFLREGQAVADSLAPERILVGADDQVGKLLMARVYAPFIARGVRYFETDVRTAELAKHACNAFLALKISYANALARLCDASGADVVAIAEIMGADSRIGRAFLDAGIGYGGYCLPKDLAAFRAESARLGYDFRLLQEVARINADAVESAFEKIRDAVWNLEEKRITLFGLAFKGGTDDVRDSPALALARRLRDAGAMVAAYDPAAGPNALEAVPALTVHADPYDAAQGAHCVVIATDWPEFRTLDLARLKGIVTDPVLVDGRNLLDPEIAAEAGFTYVPIGRPPANL